MFEIVDKIEEFFRELRLGGIQAILESMFLDLNDKVELVANDVGQTPMCWNSDVFQIPTMKSLGSDKQESKVSKTNSTENCDQIATVEEKIDFSNVKIEPLFEETVDFDTFSKSDFRAVKLNEYVAVSKSKKLLQFTLDDGTGVDRTILSGIHAYYEPEELIGKTLIAITNLPPRAMMGVESCGMLLSAINQKKDSDEEELHLLMVDNHISAGAKLY